MKKFFAFTLAALLVALVGVAQTAPATSGAEIEFEKTTHDFGAIEYQGDGSYTFVFTNTGKVPLLINTATSTCGCTVPSYPKTPIAPGEKGEITVRYDTSRKGTFHKGVTIRSNASTNETVVLYIKGEVK